MFTPARYVIVDDSEEELQLLTVALQQMGAACLPLHYDQAEGIDESKLCGVRLLFLDLHLTTGAQTNDSAGAAAIIAAMLENGITATSGPYVIILWTKHEAQKLAFETYIMDNLEPSKRPFAILSLDKTRYLGDGNAKRLISDVSVVVETDPRLRALFNWEREVLRAAGSTLSEVGALVSDADRRAPRFSERLDEILSLLAKEAVGKENAERDPFSAINTVLLPMMSDRIANQRTNQESQEVWQAAVTKIGSTPDPDLISAAKLNTMLHVASPLGEAISATSWGALTLISANEVQAFISRKLGIEHKPLLAGAFCVAEPGDRKKCRLAVLRIGASCDYAQSRPGPIPLVLGAVIPASAARRDCIPKAECSTPPLMLDGFDDPVILAFNMHFLISMIHAEMEGWAPVCRLREALLMQITAHGATNATRPAIVRFAPSMTS